MTVPPASIEHCVTVLFHWSVDSIWMHRAGTGRDAGQGMRASVQHRLRDEIGSAETRAGAKGHGAVGHDNADAVLLALVGRGHGYGLLHLSEAPDRRACQNAGAA